MTASSGTRADLALGAARGSGSRAVGAVGQLGSADLRRFKKYPAYQDSGVEWLGEIPAHWSTQRLKYVADEPIKNGIGEAGAYDNPEWPRYVRITDIAGPRALRDDTFKSLPPELARQAPFREGDLLLAAVGATFGKSYLHVANVGQVCFAGYLVRLSPSRKLDASFAAYWTESAPYWALVQSRVVQATIQNFSAAKYRDLSIPLPTPVEQRDIVAFLDRETTRIDALVAKKERLIDLLQEKRAALITRAVTKGLDPDVPMKDSGVEWLGEIPAHWEVCRLKNLSPSLGVGVVVNPSQYIAEEGVPFLYGSDISEDRILADGSRRISPRDSQRLPKSRLHKGDLVMVRVGAPGVTAVVPSELEGANCASVLVIRKGHGVDSRWLCFTLNSPYVRSQVEAVQYGAAQEQFNVAHAVNFLVAVPPLAEQLQIAGRAEHESTKIDALVGKVREAIHHLKELRTGLISAAVTGKIDVRGLA